MTERIFIRKVEKITTYYEVWTSTAARRPYIEKDGHCHYNIPLSEKVNVLEGFEQPTEREHAAIVAKLDSERPLGSCKIYTESVKRDLIAD